MGLVLATNPRKNMKYPVIIKKDTSGYSVKFRDIPEALTCGDTEEEALEMASDALLTAFEFYFEDDRTIPNPSKPKAGEKTVTVPAGVAAKILLLNEMLSSGVSRVELARRMHTRPQEVQRIINLEHATKIDTIHRALSALGKELHITVS